jgi:1-deoxy-D-xylulose-5-phosphate synthase
VVHDVALQNLPVVFALDRAGLVGADGPTHAGAYDIAYLRCIPNLSVLTPADENECRQALYTAFLQDGPTAVRYPRGAGVGAEIQREMTAIPFGKGELRREASRALGQGGKRVAILAFGTMLYPALEAAERLDATVANMRFAKPLDVALVTELARSHDAIVTIEEGCAMGGAGSAVLEALQTAGIEIPVLVLGLPDRFIEHGDSAKLLAMCGLDAAGIEQSVLKRFGARPALVRPAANR